MVVKLVLGLMHRKSVFGPHAALKLGPYLQDSLYSLQHEVPYNLRTLAFVFLYLGSFCVNELHHTTHFSFLVQFSALCPKPWNMKHWRIESVVLNSLTLKIMPVFWHTSPLKVVPQLVLGHHFLFL